MDCPRMHWVSAGRSRWVLRSWFFLPFVYFSPTVLLSPFAWLFRREMTPNGSTPVACPVCPVPTKLMSSSFFFSSSRRPSLFFFFFFFFCVSSISPFQDTGVVAVPEAGDAVPVNTFPLF